MSKLFPLACTAIVSVCASLSAAQTIDPYYACAYEFTDIGSPPGVPSSLGGLVFLAGDPDTLLIGGLANSSGGVLHSVPVVRDAEGHITGFGPESTLFAAAPNIDGGLCYGPDGVLFYSRYNVNHIGQIRAGETTTARDDNLYDLGFSGSVGAIMVVPEGFQGAGRLKVLPYNSGRWHDATLTPDGNGTFDISGPLTDITLNNGPEGIVYVEAGASLFPFESILVCEYPSGNVVSYEVDTNGDPIAESRRIMISGLGGAEGGTRDPITGDFLFSTFGGGSRVIVVNGFTPDCEVRANLNRDCLLDFFDVLLFLQSFAAQQPIGDYNDDGIFDFFDALAFLGDFAGGC